MAIKITYINKDFSKSPNNQIFFVDEKFNISSIVDKISNQESSYLKDLLKTCDLKKNLLVFEVSSKKKNNFNIYQQKPKNF